MHKIGYALVGIGVAVLAIWGAKEFLTDPEVDPLIRAAIAALCIGLVVLLVAVTRDRIKASKTDRFKGVER
jgi:hypothetical protein